MMMLDAPFSDRYELTLFDTTPQVSTCERVHGDLA